MRKGIEMKILMLLFLSILLIAPITCVNAQTITLNVDPPQLTVDLGEQFTVKVNITNVEDPGLYAYEFKLYFNKTLLNVTSAGYPPDHFLAGVPNFAVPVNTTEANNVGYVHFGVTILVDQPQTGSGILTTVNFTGIGVGTSLLEIKDVLLLDIDGNEFPYSGNNGVVTVIPEFTLALLLFAFLSLTLVTIKLRKRIRVHCYPSPSI